MNDDSIILPRPSDSDPFEVMLDITQESIERGFVGIATIKRGHIAVQLGVNAAQWKWISEMGAKQSE